MHTYLFDAGNFSIVQRMDCKGTDKGFAITPNSWQTKNVIMTLLSNEEIYEIPAGKLEEGEIPLEAAKREMLEETGYEPLEMIFLGDMYPTGGYSSEIIHLYYCPKYIKKERHLDKDEVIDLVYLSDEEVEKLIVDNVIKDAKSIAAIHLYKSKFLK